MVLISLFPIRQYSLEWENIRCSIVMRFTDPFEIRCGLFCHHWALAPITFIKLLRFYPIVNIFTHCGSRWKITSIYYKPMFVNYCSTTPRESWFSYKYRMSSDFLSFLIFHPLSFLHHPRYIFFTSIFDTHTLSRHPSIWLHIYANNRLY